MDIGLKLKELRIQKALTQEELADRAELSKGFISQLERNLTSPSISTLTDILQCLGTSLNEFFSEEDDSQIVFKQEDFFEKEDDTLHNKIEWIIPNAQKNMMEPVLVELLEGVATAEDIPHEGEEFGYVLQGAIYLVVGEKKTRVRTGCSFCIHPRETHYLMNAGKTKARVLWVSNPPTF